MSPTAYWPPTIPSTEFGHDPAKIMSFEEHNRLRALHPEMPEMPQS